MLREEVTTNYKDAVWLLFNNQCNEVASGTLYSYHLISCYATPFDILYPSLSKESYVWEILWLGNAAAPWKTLGFYHMQIHHVLFT